MIKIYLAGIMDAVSDKPDYMTVWRKKATDYFEANHHQIVTLDPCRRPHNCGLTPGEIVYLDLKDVENSDILLVDCRNHNLPTFGTPIEIFHMRYNLKKPVIGWYDGELPAFSIFQKVFVMRMFPSLLESMDHIITNYT
jgi:hypothetical protein